MNVGLPALNSTSATDPAMPRITRIERAVIEGKRPRKLGCNGRIGAHGDRVGDPVARVFTDDGIGVGYGPIPREEAESLVGRDVDDLFHLPTGTTEDGRKLDIPLWDLAAKRAGKPLYQLLGARGSREVEMYDGSIYIDDLDMSDEEAVALYQNQVKSGQDYGFTNFKVKIGRGARWMGIMEGLARDELVIRTIRDTAGPDAKILIDANMGNTLNTALHILRECADVGIYWFEEPFAEDPPLNQALKEAITEAGWPTLVADGEFVPPPSFFRMVEEGWIDVVQHDFRIRSLTWWVETAAMIEPWGARCGPHTWGNYTERYPHAHFAASVPHYEMLESSPVDMPGLVLDGWEERDGRLIVPDTPGIGFDIEDDVWQEALEGENAYVVS